MPVCVRFLAATLSTMIFVTTSSSILLAQNVQQDIGAGGNSQGYDMAPETTLPVVEAAVRQISTPMAPGPVKPTWDSLEQHYRVPDWYRGAKLGIFIHWGIFSVPAHGNEWYEKFMYAGGHDSVLQELHSDTSYTAWHTEHFASPDKFGYKDFIPKFTAAHFDPASWAALFHEAGARFVVPGAQHHENFAMWDSKVTPFNAVKMGPHQDVIGELAKAVRAQGMKFGVANHGIENFEFVNPPVALATKMKAEQSDLYDPKWASFYNVADRSDVALEHFLVNWYQRNVELIDQYQPDLIYFDNGIDQRYLDPLKLKVAAYYYNRAAAWGKQVSFLTKKAAFAPSGSNLHTIGSIIDFEGYSPKDIRSGVWEEDNTIGIGSWGYTRELRVKTVPQVIGMLVDAASKNGTLLLNVSPMADGTIPADQQAVLRGLGRWLSTNGEAIYDSHSWIRANDAGGDDICFTAKGDALYAVVLKHREQGQVLLRSLATGSAGKIVDVTQLGSSAPLRFQQTAAGLKVDLATQALDGPFTLKITGLQLRPAVLSLSGNPIQP